VFKGITITFPAEGSMSISYLQPSMIRNQRRQTINLAVRSLRPRADQFDAIAFRGMSGALIAPILADYLDKRLILVRKEKEPSHGLAIEYEATLSSRWIIVDDFIGSFRTCNSIWEACKGVGFKHPVAVFTYCRGEGYYKGPRHKFDDGVAPPIWGTLK
jgi:adenine/guanine phosphoribosyltransferase-like PRPP-binding protein